MTPIQRTRSLLSANDRIRGARNRLMLGLLAVGALVAALPLVFVLFYVFQRGIQGLSWSFFTALPKPVGEAGGGLGNAVLGTLMVVAGACLVGIPFGIGSGIYLAEYPRSRFTQPLRFSVELLAGVPSIVLGIFAYAVIVVPMKGFSALAGALALAIILVPTVAKTTEEVLKLVPDHLREAGLALGLPRWKVILRLIVRGARAGIGTGVMLAVARVSGETAPLLFTALNSQFWPKSFLAPVSTLPVQIYVYAISPFEDWNQLAWTGALVLVLFVLLANVAMRAILRRKS